MALSKKQAAEVLAKRNPTGRRGPVAADPEVRAKRQRASNRAQQDAKQALVNLHRDEYQLLYRLARDKRLEQEGL